MKKDFFRLMESILAFVPDKLFLKIKYWFKMKKRLSFKNMNTYNEKLQWLKLYDRNPKYTALVDKYEVKSYVSNIIGDEFLIPTLGVWTNFSEIDFDTLPNSFVLKCTHDSGGIVICKDKSTFDINAAKKKIEIALGRDFYILGREWPYKNVVPRIIAEPYMQDSQYEELRDYKFFVFNGKAQLLFIATDRANENKETCFDFFDMGFNHLDIRNGHPNAEVFPAKPYNFEVMKELAEKLACGLELNNVRVDLYEVDGKIYFGELTFFHHSGFSPFEPEEWDYKLGELIDLSKYLNS